MVAATDNIELLARAICARDLRRVGWSETDVTRMVERHWHCVAAEIEAGLFDDNGQLVPHHVEEGVLAYRDWRQRHPDYTPPPPAGKLN